MVDFKPVREIEEEPFKPVREAVPDTMTWGEVGVSSLKNIPRSAYDYAASIIGAIVHPVETIKGVGQAAAGAIEKIPGGVYLTPGPAYQQVGEVDERAMAIEALTGYYKERYGSIEGFKRAVAQDPVGITADAATLLTGAGGATSFTKAGRRTARIGAGVEPLNLMATPLRATKRLIPKAATTKMYESAVKFSTTLSRNERSRLTKTAMDHRILPTYGGLDKLNDKINFLNNEIATRIDDLTKQGMKIKTKDLFKEFDSLKHEQRLTGKPREAQKAINSIKKQIIDANNKYLTPAEAQKLKQNIYRDFDSYYSEVSNSPASVIAQKAVARAAKESIEELIPEIKQLNQRDGDLIALRKEIQRAALRISNRDILSMGTTVRAAGGGAVAGAPGLAVGLGLGLLDSQPVLKARLAMLLEKMKQKGIKVRMTPAIIRLTTYQAGEIAEQVKEQ